jgi:hypothetical protein
MSDGHFKVRRTSEARDVSDNRNNDSLDRSRHGDRRSSYHERDRRREYGGSSDYGGGGGGGGGGGSRSSNSFSRDRDGRDRLYDSVNSEDMKRKRVPEERAFLPASALGQAPVVRVGSTSGGGNKNFKVACERETDQSKIAQVLVMKLNRIVLMLLSAFLFATTLYIATKAN